MRTAKIGPDLRLLQIMCLTNFTHFLYMYVLGPGPLSLFIAGLMNSPYLIMSNTEQWAVLGPVYMKVGDPR